MSLITTTIRAGCCSSRHGHRFFRPSRADPPRHSSRLQDHPSRSCRHSSLFFLWLFTLVLVPTQYNEFLPGFANGEYTASKQATWTVEGNDDYLIYGGEFVAVNGIPQQGLVRFSLKGDKKEDKKGDKKEDKNEGKKPGGRKREE